MRLGNRKWPRYLRAVARTQGMITAEEADLLYRAAAETSSGAIVEVGSYRGRSTVALALGSRAGHRMPVYAVDPHEPFTGALGGDFGPEDRGAFYRAMLRTEAFREVRLINLSSAIVTPGWTNPVGMLWLDGDHTLEGVTSDFESWRPFLLAGAPVFFDDATDPALGPHQLLGKLLHDGTVNEVAGAGKIRVITHNDNQ